MLDRLTIERMMAKAGDTPILIALSGGGDSVALLHLLVDELRGHDLRAVIVDHKLRKGSTEDAERAADIGCMAGCGGYIEDAIWPESANRGHEAARRARYAALCNAARKCGAHVIVTGHTRDDQAETVLLRAAQGSGLRGLAGMRAWSPMPVWPEGRGLWLARPLLNVRRQALRDELGSRGAKWIEDPANLNHAYARVRVRHKLEELEDDRGFDPMRLAELAERLAPLADAVDDAGCQLIEATATFDTDTIALRPSFLEAGAEVRRRALWALVTAAGAHERGPGSEQVAALDAAMQAPAFNSATLGGALIRAVRGEIVLTRDRGALDGRADGAAPLPPLALEAGKETIWDRRVALTSSESGWSVGVENGAPVLVRGEERAALAAASPQWLIKTRVQHALGLD